MASKISLAALKGAAILSIAVMGLAPAAALDINTISLTGEAVEGYDVVAYWTTGQPTPGTRAYAVEIDGIIWRFASPENRDRFAEDPARYMPAFGGHCAFAMSKGVKADIHPYMFEISQGQLFLFASAESRARFDADRAVEHAAASNWEAVKEQYF